MKIGWWPWRSTSATKQDIENSERKIMAKLNTLGATLSAIADEVDKIGKEVATLQASLGDAEIPPAAQAALDRLTAAVKAVDDLNPDAS